jgi:hypothetical protein
MLMNDAFAAMFERRRTEVDQQAQGHLEQAKVGEHLLGMHRQ